jgi:hypothetical protein
MLLVIVKLDEPEVRSNPRRWEEADLGPSTDEETPNASAATTSAMALDAITNFVLLNRSGFICSSTASSVMGKPTEGPQVPPPEIPR